MKPRRIDDFSAEYSFCPGKATWFEEIVEAYEQCRVARETGILPDKGSFKDQSQMFVEVFPFFVQRWNERLYMKVWNDIRQFSDAIMGGGKTVKK